MLGWMSLMSTALPVTRLRNAKPGRMTELERGIGNAQHPNSLSTPQAPQLWSLAVPAVGEK